MRWPSGWTIADDSDGATLPGVVCATEGWWNCHLTTDEVRRVIVVEPSHVAGGWRVVEGVMRRHPDGSISPDDWPSVEWHESREAALAMAMASARGTWAEECPDHGWEAVTPRESDVVLDCGRVVPGYVGTVR